MRSDLVCNHDTHCGPPILWRVHASTFRVYKSISGKRYRTLATRTCQAATRLFTYPRDVATFRGNAYMPDAEVGGVVGIYELSKFPIGP
ncbi:hypothetical protein SCLCIDRAFT_1219449 [Scleroderma citrinum Foug A]|uniref:Uncharacterized protein n=1 Tax=Scleroderma citrinum Foug A TaxID=1036808 RepID=A0A0C3D9J3_9AGAM|nr:hypothetical protein SCLCIDRAFT_1219449 [Scleroderma citrinum Foug A]